MNKTFDCTFCSESFILWTQWKKHDNEHKTLDKMKALRGGSKPKKRKAQKAKKLEPGEVVFLDASSYNVKIKMDPGTEDWELSQGQLPTTNASTLTVSIKNDPAGTDWELSQGQFTDTDASSLNATIKQDPGGSEETELSQRQLPYTDVEVKQELLEILEENAFAYQEVIEEYSISSDDSLGSTTIDSISPSKGNYGTFRCDICNIILKKKYSFKKHVVNLHQNARIYKCSMCEDLFLCLCNLKSHLRDHQGERSFAFVACGKLLDDSSEVESHGSTREKKSLDDNSEFESHGSTREKKSFDDSSEFESHGSTREKKSFDDSSEFESHGSTREKKSFDDSSEFESHGSTREKKCKYQCQMCDASFTKAQKLLMHLRHHSTPLPRDYGVNDIYQNPGVFKCPLCEDSFLYESNLKIHLRITHECVKMFVCVVCANSFAVKSQFFKHLTTHAKGPIFDCQVCSELYPSSKELIKHLRHHYVYTGFKNN